MGWFGSFVYKDKKTKQKWWLHSKQRGKVTYYFFSKEQTDALEGIPPGYEITVNERSGIPLLRKTSKRKAKEKYAKDTARGQE